MSKQSGQWNPRPNAVNLISGQVHVWRFCLNPPAPALQQLEKTLSADEVSQAQRYHFDRDRRRFIVRWATLREILGHYLGLMPEQLRFIFGKCGKPTVAPDLSQRKIYFNLAHSDEIALLAVSAKCEVGIDVERIREDIALMDLAQRHFSPAEVSALDRLPPDEQRTAFFRLWTLKEAYLKGIGLGLSSGLDNFSVSFNSEDPQIWLKRGGELRPAGNWTLRHLELGRPFCGALAVNQRAWQLDCFQWP